MKFTLGFIFGLALALAISSRAETVYASVWTFGGDNTWTPKEWREIFKSTQEFYKERLNVKIKVVSWRNNHQLSICAKRFKYNTEKGYGNCLLKKTARARNKFAGFNLFLTPPIPSGFGDTYVGGISTGICQPHGGTAMVHGKRISTHTFEDGGNAGWEMTRLAVIHEIGHVALGMHHPEDVGRATPINIMDTEALGYLVGEYQIKNKISGEWENFRDVLPLTKFSKWEVKQCLGAHTVAP